MLSSVLPQRFHSELESVTHAGKSTKTNTAFPEEVLRQFLKNLIDQYPQISSVELNPTNDALSAMRERRKARIEGKELSLNDIALLKTTSVVQNSNPNNLILNYALAGSLGTSLWALADSYQLIENGEVQTIKSQKTISDEQRTAFKEFLRPVKDIDVVSFGLYPISPGSLKGFIDLDPKISINGQAAVEVRPRFLSLRIASRMIENQNRLNTIYLWSLIISPFPYLLHFGF